MLERIGKESHHIGPSGHGSLMKLVVNGIMGLGLQALAEGLLLGQAGGLDPERMTAALDAVAVLSPHHKRKLRSAMAGDFAPQFPAGLMAKDFRLLIDEAARLGLVLPAGAAAAAVCGLTAARDGEADYSRTIETVRAFQP